MAKILLAAWGSAGDVLPMVSVGVELRRRGHDVTVIAMPNFESVSLGVGLSFVAVGSAEIYRRLSSPEVWSGRPLSPDLAAFLARELPPVRVDRYLEVVGRLHEPGRTVLVAHPRATGALLAHRRLHIPLAIVEFSPIGRAGPSTPPHPPFPLPSSLKRSPLVRRATRRALALHRAVVRRLSGRSYPAELLAAAVKARVRALPPVPATSRQNGPPPKRVFIAAWPPWFAPVPVERTKEPVPVGFIFENPAAVAALASAGRPKGAAGPLIFTMGSIAGGQQRFFAAAAEACAILGRPGVLVTRYPDQIPGRLPPEVTHLEHAPFVDLFRDAAAVVHHGGIGTVALALAAAVPQVIKPMNWDHFDNADHMERLGVGRAINSRRVDGAGLASTLAGILSSSAVAERCQHWSGRIDPDMGAVRAAELVETLQVEPGA